MQASEHSIARFTFIILHEFHLTYLSIKVSFIKRLKEIASMITEHLWLDDHNTVNSSLYYFHSSSNRSTYKYINILLFIDMYLTKGFYYLDTSIAI